MIPEIRYRGPFHDRFKVSSSLPSSKFDRCLRPLGVPRKVPVPVAPPSGAEEPAIEGPARARSPNGAATPRVRREVSVPCCSPAVLLRYLKGDYRVASGPRCDWTNKCLGRGTAGGH